MDRKIHLVNWNIVCSSKEYGGLSIRNLSVVNRGIAGEMGLEICRGGELQLERSDQAEISSRGRGVVH